MQAMKEFMSKAKLTEKELPPDGNIETFIVEYIEAKDVSKQHMAWWKRRPCQGKDSYTHLAAEVSGLLPVDFPYWDLSDSSGHTPAHVAVKWGTLPKGFSKWNIGDGVWTVAHAMMEKKGSRIRDIPKHCLYYTDMAGMTPAHISALHCNLTKSLPLDGSYDDILALEDLRGVTVAQMCYERDSLPAMFFGWHLRWRDSSYDIIVDDEEYVPEDFHGWTIAHQAAADGRLPKNVPESVLYICDDNGISVRDVQERRIEQESELKSMDIER